MQLYIDQVEVFCQHVGSSFALSLYLVCYHSPAFILFIGTSPSYAYMYSYFGKIVAVPHVPHPTPHTVLFSSEAVAIPVVICVISVSQTFFKWGPLLSVRMFYGPPYSCPL
jgi:hypothetical protein